MLIEDCRNTTKERIDQQKHTSPFELISKESFQTRIEARNREKYLKSGVGKEYLRSLLK
jgi:hypothetical protein